MFILPDFPENSSSWLTPAEKTLAMQRMQEVAGSRSRQQDLDAPDLSKQPLGHFPGLHLAVTDWKVWWLSVALLFLVTSLSFNVYFPTLTATLGYGPIVTLLLCAPPWLFATGVALTLSRYVLCNIFPDTALTLIRMFRHSDRVGERSKHIASSLIVGMCGFVLSISTMNTAVRYISL